MKILIDGYNILKNCLQVTQISEQQRTAFIQQLQRYARIKKHTILLIFDGGLDIWPFQEQYGLVTIVYVGKQKSADDYIVHYMQHHAHQDILLISNDRALTQQADNAGLNSLNVKEFCTILNNTTDVQKMVSREPRFVHKKVQSPETALDMIMQQAGQIITPKTEDIIIRKKSKKDTLSKEEKKLLRKINKL